MNIAEDREDVVYYDGICVNCNHDKLNLYLSYEVEDSEVFCCGYGYCPNCFSVTDFYPFNMGEEESIKRKVIKDFSLGKLNLGQYIVKKLQERIPLINVQCAWCNRYISSGIYKAINHDVWYCDACAETPGDPEEDDFCYGNV
jgi:hypothetical protein